MPPSRVRSALSLAKALAGGGERREAAVAAIVRPENLFQPFTTTGFDRYPEEFGIVRDALTTADPRILSFGCSSGEELLTLRQYFPGARIHGIDANPLAVRTARKRVAGDDRITVAKGSDAGAEAAESYDVVTALAVFRHADLNSSPARTDGVLAFADFEMTLAGLVACVKPGGLLVIRHANFRFGDCAFAADFAAVRTGFASAGIEGLPTPVYGPDDALLDLSCRDDGIYRRVT